MWTGVVSYYIPAVAYNEGPIYDDGSYSGFNAGSFTSVCIVVVLHAVMIGYQIRTWNWIQILLHVLNIVFFFPLTVLPNDGNEESNIFRNTWDALDHGKFWLVLLIGVGVICLPYYGVRCY
jgi:hypothetical protein